MVAEPVDANNAPTEIASGELAAVESGPPDLRPRVKEIPQRYEALVEAKVQIVIAAQEAGDLEAFQVSLTQGLICDSAVEVLKKAPSLRTLYRWMREYKEDGAAALMPKYALDAGRERIVPELVQAQLLKILLHPNQVAPGTAVMYVMDHWKQVKRQPIGASERTLLRWIEDWRKEHTPEWTLAREGMKALREKVNRTVLRDWSQTAVGEVWFSDGHRLAVMLIDPRDGKPKRFELIMWFDAASTMPMGGWINLTENTEGIQISFRNACLFAGFKPRAVYLDNGKAYKSKYFSGSKKSADDIELELQGVFGRMGIEVIHSMPYNAKAKNIERWWQTLQNQVERMTPAWTGRHAMAKPANLARDEKWVKGKFEHQAMAIEDFKLILEYWMMEIYAKQEHPSRKGKTRLEVYLEGKAEIPQERFISPEELNWMLLAIDKKRVTSQGITINKTVYWDASMVRYVGRDVIVRTDYWDVRSILVYDEKDRFICQAPLRTLMEPLVKLNGDDTSRRALEKDLAEIRSVEKRVKRDTAQILKRVSDATDAAWESLPDETRTQMLSQEGLLPQIKPKANVDELMADLQTMDEPEEPAPQDDESAALAEMMGITNKKINK